MNFKVGDKFKFKVHPEVLYKNNVNYNIINAACDYDLIFEIFEINYDNSRIHVKLIDFKNTFKCSFKVFERLIPLMEFNNCLWIVNRKYIKLKQDNWFENI